MAEKVKPKDVSREEFASGWKETVRITSYYLQLQHEANEAEERLKKVREELKKLETTYPHLGNVKGVLKIAAARHERAPVDVEEESSEEEAPTEKPQVKQVKPPAAKKQKSSRQRLAEKIASPRATGSARESNPEFIRHTADVMEHEKTGAETNL